MKASRYLLITLICMLTVFACKKSKQDDVATGTTSTSVADDKQFLTNSMTDVSQCIAAVNSGTFANAFYAFTGLNNGTAANTTWMELLRDQLDAQTGFNTIYTEWQLNFSQAYGIYTWNHTTQVWDKTSHSNAIILNFPSDPGQISNDCQFELTQYSDQLYFVNNDSVHLPTAVTCSMKKNGNSILELNYLANYIAPGFPVPQYAELNLFVAPYYYNLHVERLTPTQFRVDGTVQTGTGCEIVYDTQLSFANTDFDQFEISEDLNNVVFTIRRSDLKVSGSWDAHAYYSFTNPSSTQLNSTIYIEVLWSGNKIGDLRFNNVGNGNELFIFYKDGSSENSSIYHSPLYSDITSMLEPYWGPL